MNTAFKPKETSLLPPLPEGEGQGEGKRREKIWMATEFFNPL